MNNNPVVIRAAIIEDEIPAARLLNHMLAELRPEWEILLLPGNIEEAAEWFSENTHPDLLFLDIQLTDGNSFLLIEKACPKSMIVFTTAFDTYAVSYPYGCYRKQISVCFCGCPCFGIVPVNA